MDKKINDFVIFCTEIYKEKNKLTGKQVYEIFEKYDIFKYLEDGFEALHTQGKEWILENIDNLLESRGYEK